MRARTQSGLTLVELILAISIFLILLVAAALIYGDSLKLFIRDRITQDLQRQGDAILANMSVNLREATSVNPTGTDLVNNPNSLTVNLNGSQTRRYYVTTGQLHYVSETGQDSVLVQPGTTVTSLTFQPSTNTEGGLTAVRVQATLSQTKNSQSSTLNIGSTITTRPQ